MTQEQFDGDQDTKNSVVASLSEGATATQLNAKTGIIGRFCAVRYYHESVCYYDVLIRHDQNVTEKMALGRYGVVRNNWYHLELQSVSGPGTPWIPDPSDPMVESCIYLRVFCKNHYQSMDLLDTRC